MSQPRTELLNQFNVLLRLTSTEAATARARVSQATTDATREELAQNARNSDARAQAIRDTVTALGGVPDAVGVALGRVATAGRLPLEQSTPVTEALLADLALEHQLFDRARLVKVLARAQELPQAVALAERLEEAHGATIEWLFTVLAETAIGGPAALAPTPAQTAAATARQTATLAGTLTAKGLNRAVSTAAQVGQRVPETLTRRADRARQLATSAGRIARAGRNATLAETERQAERVGSGAEAVHRVREGLGAVSGSELPVPGYDSMTTRDAVAAVGDLTSAEDVRVVLAYERSHKARPQIVTAAERRVAQIAQELVTS